MLELFGHDKISMIFAAGVLLLGLAAAILLWATTVARTRQIRRAIAAVESAGDKQEFARHFDAISTRIESLRLLQPHWINFKSTLLFSHHAEAGETIVHCTANVSDQFSIARINESWRDVRVLPGLFLTMALLLTVVGAATSMTTALDAIDHGRTNLDAKNGNAQPIQTKPTARLAPGTAQATQQTSRVAPPQAALHQFLSAGKASFALAIAGLSISLLLTIVLRTCASRLKSSLHALSAALQQRVVRISFEVAVLGRLATISTATAGLDATANATIGKNLKLAIEQSLPHHFEHATEKMHRAIDLHLSRNAEATKASSNALAMEIDKLISDRVTDPIHNTNEQLQDQFLGLRENFLSLSNIITTAGSGLDAIEKAELELSSFVDAAEQVQDKLASSNRDEIRDLASDLKTKIEREVVDPLRGMNTSIVDLKSSLAAVQDSIASAAPASTLDDTAQASYVELSAKLQDLKTSIEHDRVALNGQLITEMVERLEASVAQPIDKIANTFKEVRTNFEAEAAADGSVNLHETIQNIETRLVRLDDAASAVGSLAATHNMVSATDDQDNKLLEQNQTAIKYLADRFETHIVSPLQQLTASTAEVRQALSDNELQAADAIRTNSDEILHSIRIEADDLRGEIRALMARSDGSSPSPTFPDQMRQYCENLDRVSQQLVHNSSAIETQLKQLVETLPVDGSRKEEAAHVAEQFERDRGALPIEDLGVSGAAKQEMLSSTQQKALKILDQMSAESALATSGLQIAADDVHTAINILTNQAQVEWEGARLILIEQIDQSDQALDEMTLQWNQNASTITTQFKQLIESAPANWSRETEEVAEAAERTVRLVVHDTRRLLEQSASSRTTAIATDEMGQTTAALAQISDHLVQQTAETRDVISSQLASTMNVIERASTNIFATISGLGDSLTQDARAVANDVLELAGQGEYGTRNCNPEIKCSNNSNADKHLASRLTSTRNDRVRL